MRRQADISAAQLQHKIGTRQTVLVDAQHEGDSIARSYADAPEIDGNVIIEGSLHPVGEMLEVEIVEASDYDLFATPITD